MANNFFNKRTEYLKKFKVNAEGKYVYTGVTYIFNGTEKKRKTYSLLIGLFIAVFLGLCILSGFVNAGGMWYAKYVILPYVIEVIAVFIYIIASIQYLFETYPLPDVIYNKTIPVFKATTAGCAVIGLAEIITTVIYMLINGTQGYLINCLGYIGIKLLFAAAGAFLFMFLKKNDWHMGTEYLGDIE